MNSYEYELIDTKQGYSVSKDNQLVQRSRYSLSLSEQKTIAYICSMIKPIKAEDRAKKTPFQLEYTFDIREYCKVCEIDYDNGNNYKKVKETLKKLSDRSMWVTFDKNPDEEVLCRWLQKVRTNKKSGKAIIEIDRDLAPYLFDLQQRFTAYPLYNILPMQSAFSIRLYELLKSYAHLGGHTFDLDELKRLLMVEDVKSYKDFSLFRIKVLKVAQEEIKKWTDMEVEFEAITKGKKTIKVKFTIKEKRVKEEKEETVQQEVGYIKLTKD